MEETMEIIFKNYPPNRKEYLVPIMQDIQSQYGFLPEPLLQKVSEFLSIPINKIYGVATFYDQFKVKPSKEPPAETRQIIQKPFIISAADKSFLLEKVMKNMSGDYKKDDQEKLTFLKKEKVTQPVIFLGTGSCGVNSGADQTLAAINKFLECGHPPVEL